MVSLWGASSLIRSVQRATITLGPAVGTATATIAAVSLPDSRLVLTGLYNAGGDTNLYSVACRVTLTNATTVTADVNSTGAGNREVSFEVIEYAPGVVRSLQIGTYTTVASQTGTVAVTAVNTDKSILDNLGFTSNDATTTMANGVFRQVLTNATTVDGKGYGTITRTAVSYQVVEFF